ncbi:MAG: tyrosine-type recombinase/integrase [Candidatus Marinimicrobia bacterium]|nr:tyrosine-type recombinase/integrase [Candidatus Neomarinimicrobiota bacterium]
MSSLYKRGDSHFYWWSTNYEGKRLRRSTKTASKRIAIEFQQKWDYELLTDPSTFFGNSINQNGLVDDFLDHYLDLRKRKAGKTYTTAIGMINKFRKYVLSINISKIEDINVRVLDNYVNEFTCSSKTIKNHFIELSVMFNQAVKEGIISSNPAKLVTLPQIISSKPLHRNLEEEDLQIIFGSGGCWKLYYQFLLYTGLRAGDVALLKYKDIDLDNGTIVTLIRKSRRTHEFPLSRLLMDQIPDLDSNSTIFPELYTENERKLNDNLAKPRLYMQALLKAENRKHATLHSFRVTYNNNLLGLGCSIQDRQKLLAHSSSETTKIYTHPNFELAQSYVDQLPDIMGLIECDQNVTKMCDTV